MIVSFRPVPSSRKDMTLFVLEMSKGQFLNFICHKINYVEILS